MPFFLLWLVSVLCVWSDVLRLSSAPHSDCVIRSGERCGGGSIVSDPVCKFPSLGPLCVPVVVPERSGRCPEGSRLCFITPTCLFGCWECRKCLVWLVAWSVRGAKRYSPPFLSAVAMFWLCLCRSLCLALTWLTSCGLSPVSLARAVIMKAKPVSFALTGLSEIRVSSGLNEESFESRRARCRDWGDRPEIRPRI